MTPKLSAKVRVTGIDPPSRVRSGVRLYTACPTCSAFRKGEREEKSHLRSLDARLIIPVLVIRYPWDATMEILNAHGALCVEFSEFICEVLLDFGTYIIRMLRWNKSGR